MNLRRHNFANLTARLGALLLLCLATAAHAEPSQVVNAASGSLLAAQAAVQGAASTASGEALTATAQAGGYDWSLLIALVFGVIGLIWMRRHIANL